MAQRDRYRIKIRDGEELSIEARLQGGEVDYRAPDRDRAFYWFREFGPKPLSRQVRTLEVNPADIVAIIQDQAPVKPRAPRKSSRSRSTADNA